MKNSPLGIEWYVNSTSNNGNLIFPFYSIAVRVRMTTNSVIWYCVRRGSALHVHPSLILLHIISRVLLHNSCRGPYLPVHPVSWLWQSQVQHILCSINRLRCKFSSALSHLHHHGFPLLLSHHNACKMRALCAQGRKERKTETLRFSSNFFCRKFSVLRHLAECGSTGKSMSLKRKKINPT